MLVCAGGPKRAYWALCSCIRGEILISTGVVTLISPVWLHARPPDRLDVVLQRLEETRAVSGREFGVAGGIARDLAQVPLEIAHAQRSADIVRREGVAVGPENTRALGQAARGERDVGRNRDIAGLDVIGDPVVCCVRALRHDDSLDQGMRTRAYAAIADDEDFQA